MKRSVLNFVLPGVVAALLLSGCHDNWFQVEGNYDLEEETRQLPVFDRISNEGDFAVYIIQDGLSEVTIEAESNLIPHIRTQVKGTELEIDSKENLRNNYPMKIYVHTTDIKEVNLSGSGLIETEEVTTGDVEIHLSGSGYMLFTGTTDNIDCSVSGSGSVDIGVTAGQIDADISGSGDIELWGVADRGDFKISGSGSFNAYEMLLQECYANISGSGSMEVTVEDYLNVNISGSGNVYYMGSPDIDSKITGSGSVIHP
jgi:hypothetical protein